MTLGQTGLGRVRHLKVLKSIQCVCVTIDRLLKLSFFEGLIALVTKFVGIRHDLSERKAKKVSSLDTKETQIERRK